MRDDDGDGQPSKASEASEANPKAAKQAKPGRAAAAHTGRPRPSRPGSQCASARARRTRAGPTAEPPRSSPRTSSGAAPGQAAVVRPRVVIAEDEALIRLDLMETLGELGYEVVGEAADGEHAVALAEASAPRSRDPRRQDAGARRHLSGPAHRSGRIAPVVILTAFSQRDLVERARDAGAMAYLVKPFTSNDLLPAIEMALSRYAEAAHWRPRSRTSPSNWRPARSSTAPRACFRRPNSSPSRKRSAGSSVRRWISGSRCGPSRRRCWPHLADEAQG